MEGRIYYGSEKMQHTDEIEKDKKGYYGRYVVNNAVSGYYPTIELLIDSYVKSKYWLYVSVERNGEIKEYKNIDKELVSGVVITEDSYIKDDEEIIIKIIKYRGDIYYVRTVKKDNNTETITKLIS